MKNNTQTNAIQRQRKRDAANHKNRRRLMRLDTGGYDLPANMMAALT